MAVQRMQCPKHLQWLNSSSPSEVPMLAVTRFALALTMAAGGQDAWYEPFPAHRVIGNTYYVGSKDLASYLITTPEGHILINSGFEKTGPLIRASVESLGFK